MKKEDLIVRVEFVVIGRKTTVCLLTLENGFEIAGYSACVNANDFSKKLGEKYAYEHALSELDKYFGFYLQERQFNADKEALEPLTSKGYTPIIDFEFIQGEK